MSNSRILSLLCYNNERCATHTYVNTYTYVYVYVCVYVYMYVCNIMYSINFSENSLHIILFLCIKAKCYVV